MTSPESTGEPEDHEEEVPSVAADQLHKCAQAHLHEHTHTRNDAVGDFLLDIVEKVATQSCDALVSSGDLSLREKKTKTKTGIISVLVH